MAATGASEVSEGPVLSFINKRLRALRKKYNRIVQMEEAIAQGKPINKEQEDVLRSKPYVCASIDELEKLKQPLADAVAEEISLAVQRHQVSSSSSPSLTAAATEEENEKEPSTAEEAESRDEREHAVVQDLLNLLYFASMFDVKPQGDFTSTMLIRTHERGCCLTYDYVTDDDATDLLGEKDLDLISSLGSLMISRPVNTSLSHKNALQRCIEHAKLWLENSDQPIDSEFNITYAGLRAKLHKIMASDYFTTTPEMKAPVEVAAAAAAGSYASFQVPLHYSSTVPVQVEVSGDEYQQKEDDAVNFQGHETYDNQSSPVEEFHEGELEGENSAEISDQMEPNKSQAEMEQHLLDLESRDQQYAPRRNYQNNRGGRGGGGGGGRRGYPNGRGGRGSGRGGAPYQNGRSQYYEQPGNYYPRNNYYNNRGRGGGGRGAGGNSYNNYGSGVQAGHVTANS